MSVLIKGMEIPKNCGECPMICEDDLCHITKGGRTINERPPHCPLIEIPPHGRLIDADALEAQCDDPYWCVWLTDIKDAPTIIESEASR